MEDQNNNGMLFSDEDTIPWATEWQNMPEYNITDQSPQFSVIVNFACAADVEDFGKLLGIPITASHGRQLQSRWYPEQEISHYVNKRYIDQRRNGTDES